MQFPQIPVSASQPVLSRRIRQKTPLRAQVSGAAEQEGRAGLNGDTFMSNWLLFSSRLGIPLGVAGGALLCLAALVDTGSAAGGKTKPSPKPAGSAYASAVLADSPVAYWRLGERPGATTAADASTHKHNGKYHGKPKLGEPGALSHDKNTALGLGGPKTKSYVEVPTNKAFSVATSSKGLSVEVWLRPDALSFAGEKSKDAKNPYIHWLGKGEGRAQEWGFRFYSSKATDRPNRISAYIWNASGDQGSGAYFQDKITPGKWLHIVATYDDPHHPNAQVRIYRNGVASPHNSSRQALYKSYHIKPTAGTAPVRLGTRDLRSFLTGGLDEVAVYPHVLTPAQIRRHWQLGSEARK
jgi:hypothetical protein